MKALNFLNDSVKPPHCQSGLYYMPSLLNDPNLFFTLAGFMNPLPCFTYGLLIPLKSSYINLL